METVNPETKSEKHDLATVLTDVLGNLAFMVSDDDSVEPPPGTVWLKCEINYHGPVSAALTCWCTRDFAIQLAANLLGIEADEGDAQAAAEDAVREFMNVLCGQLVTAWYGTTDVYSLSIPAVRECLDAPTQAEASGGSHCQLSVSGEPLYCVCRQGDAG